jgi:hypothetical protein
MAQSIACRELAATGAHRPPPSGLSLVLTMGVLGTGDFDIQVLKALEAAVATARLEQ